MLKPNPRSRKWVRFTGLSAELSFKIFLNRKTENVWTPVSFHTEIIKKSVIICSLLLLFLIKSSHFNRAKKFFVIYDHNRLNSCTIEPRHLHILAIQGTHLIFTSERTNFFIIWQGTMPSSFCPQLNI